MDRWDAERLLAHGRLSGGYTLDEAARVYRSSLSARGLVCPGCGVAMRDLSTGHRAAGVSVIRCASCGRGLVLEYHAPHAAD